MSDPLRTYDLMPDVEILTALVDFLTPLAAARANNPFTVRHQRFANAPISKRPVLSIERMVVKNLEDENASFDNLSAAEYFVELSTVFIIDVDIDPNDSGNDPTGFAFGSDILKFCFEQLFPDDGNMGSIETLDGRLHDIRYEGTDETPDFENESNSDFCRMVEVVTLVYRVRSDRPHILLRNS